MAEQVFRVRYLENKNQKDELRYELGKNVIATLPGKYSEESKHVQRVLLKKIINLRTNKINKKVGRTEAETACKLTESFFRYSTRRSPTTTCC